MGNQKIILIPLQPLLGEGLQRIIQAVEDIDLVCLPCDDLEKMDSCLQDIQPDMVLLAGEKEDDHTTHLISTLLKRYEDIPIAWIELETTRLRFFTSHSLNANSAELINAIRENDVRHIEIYSMDKNQKLKTTRR